MTESEKEAAEFIKNNPYWVLGYIESLENEINRVRAAVSCDLPLAMRFIDRPVFQVKPPSEEQLFVVPPSGPPYWLPIDT